MEPVDSFVFRQAGSFSNISVLANQNVKLLHHEFLVINDDLSHATTRVTATPVASYKLEFEET